MMKAIQKPDVTTGEPANAGLDQLAGLAAAADAESFTVANPGVVVEAAPVVNYHTEAAGLTDMVAALICGYEPKCLPLWGADRKAAIAGALAPVMEKYNFTLGAIPPEITLIIIAAPPLYQSMKIIADGMKPKAQADIKKPVASVEESGATVTHDPAMMAL